MTNTQHVTLAAIVALSENNVIGKDGDLPWRIPGDLKRLKEITMGKPLIMGRKTFESLGKPLPGRPHIVLSRTKYKMDGIHSYTNIDKAIAKGKAIAAQDGMDETFIFGGGQIYERTLPQVERLYMTRVKQTIDGDTTFPKLNEEEWRTVTTESHEAGDTHPAWDFIVLERKARQE